LGIFGKLRRLILRLEERLEQGELRPPFFRSRRAVVFLIQFTLIASSALLSFVIRFDFSFEGVSQNLVLVFLLASLAVKLPMLQLFNLNRGWWRYSSVSDLVQIFRAMTLSQLILIGLQLFSITPYFPRSVFAIDFFLSLGFLCGARMAFRILHENSAKPGRNRRRKSDRRVVIIGAGDAGVALYQNLRKTEHIEVQVVGFVDDSWSKIKSNLYGLKVLGSTSQLKNLKEDYDLNEAFIAIPTLKKSRLKEITERCIEAKLAFKTIPSLSEIIEHGSRIDELRPVRVEDLLGREPIKLDKTKTEESIRGQTVLVTGAGGSIGSELCRQILAFNPKRLILIERSEFNLFKISNELKRKFKDQNIISRVGDVCDESGLSHVFEEFRPEMVFHAAAHKHVPLMESSPREAIRNNVLGTKNVVEAACRYGTKRFVMISTDKAVNPLNVMGYSKRMAELVVQSKADQACEFVSVRFGNVLGSSGSAVQIFEEQIKRGGPVTVTHAEADRFFMTTPEAVELVMHAGVHGQSGEIYMLDMGEPVKIIDLAKRMIDLSDPEGKKEIKIEITGLRPGEKVSEEILWEGEDFVDSGIPKVFLLKNKVCTKRVAPVIEQIERVVADRLDSAVSLEKLLKDSVEDLDNSVRISLKPVAEPVGGRQFVH